MKVPPADRGPPKKSPRPIPKARWEGIRAEFVHGEFRDGRHAYPTMDEIARKYDVNIHSVYSHSKRDSKNGLGSWLQQRQQAEALARARTDSIQADRIAESRATFDNHTLIAAHAGLQKLAQVLSAWTAFDTGPNGQRGLRAKAPAEIQNLAAALMSFQRVGRLALGYATDNVAYRGETKLELGEAAQAVLAAIDPKDLSFEQIELLQKVFEGVAGEPSRVLGEVRTGEVH